MTQRTQRYLMLFLTVVLMQSAPLQAQASPQEEQVLHRFSVNASGGAVRAVLPSSYYLNSKVHDYSDLRIMSAQGQAIKFAVIDTPPKMNIEKKRAPLKFYPLWRNEPPRLKDTEIPEPSPNASNAPNAKIAPKGKVFDAYIIELPEDQAEAITAITVTPKYPVEGYEANVDIKASVDLREWQSVDSSEYLSWITQKGVATVSGINVTALKINTPLPHGMRYLRLMWRSGEPLVFAKVEATLRQELTVPVTYQHAFTPSINTAEEQWHYEVGEGIRAESVRVDLPLPNSQMTVNIGQMVIPPSSVAGKDVATTAQKPYFSSVGEWVFSRVTNPSTQEEERTRAYPLSFNAREWVVRPQVAEAGRGDFSSMKPPLLTLTWQPKTLVFLTGIDTDFNVLMVDTSSTNRQMPLRSVAELTGKDWNENNLTSVSLGNLLSTPSEDLKVSASPLIPHQVYFWLLLIVGVAFMVFMAWQLWREMKKQPSPIS